MANIRDEGSTDQGMAEGTNETDHPWSTLETITTFDRGILQYNANISTRVIPRFLNYLLSYNFSEQKNHSFVLFNIALY